MQGGRSWRLCVDVYPLAEEKLRRFKPVVETCEVESIFLDGFRCTLEPYRFFALLLSLVSKDVCKGTGIGLQGSIWVDVTFELPCFAYVGVPIYAQERKAAKSARP